MQFGLMRDRRIRAIEWRDLVPVSRLRVLKETTLTLPWLVLSLTLAWLELWPFALLASFFFFLTGLRNAHDGQHENLGLSPRATDVFLFALGVVMQSSLHAVRVNHLRHHVYCLDEEDGEGACARMPWYGAILYGPVFYVRIHADGLRHGNRVQRRWILAETLAFLSWAAFVLVAQPASFLVYHVAAMFAGQCLTAFFAVWTVHHDIDPEVTFARTERGWKNRLFYGMFFHVEHHLFPRVPTCRLEILARRLDAVRPELSRFTVIPALPRQRRVTAA